MSFETYFGGVAVIHAAFLYPARRAHFEQELARVGIQSFALVETKAVPDSDPRLASFGRGRANGLLSLTDGFLAAIDVAESRHWPSIAIFEDDITMRDDFARHWPDVASALARKPWGVLTLHRTPVNGTYLVQEPFFGRTAVIPVSQNTLTHCVIVNGSHYAEFRHSLHECIRQGWPCDFFYGVFSERNPGRLVATNRNLSGQAAGLPSGLSVGAVRRNSFYAKFRSGNVLECAVLNTAHSLYRAVRRGA